MQEVEKLRGEKWRKIIKGKMNLEVQVIVSYEKRRHFHFKELCHVCFVRIPVPWERTFDIIHLA